MRGIPPALAHSPPGVPAERPIARAVHAVPGMLGDAPWYATTAEYRSRFGEDWWYRMSPLKQDQFVHMYREAQILCNELRDKTWELEVTRSKFYQLQVDMRNFVQLNLSLIHI